ncbi:MAG: hypothetical protein ACUVR4_01110 [Anaerolineae bacterium]
MKTGRCILNGLNVGVLVLVTVLGITVPLAHAQGCTELLDNGGFETDAGWQLGPTPAMPQYVTYTKHSGNRSLLLGITGGGNVQSFSSARQTVTIPAASAQVKLSFWFYAMADSPATTDYMEVVLLDPAGAILNKPWRSHNDSRAWNQLTFDLTPWRGRTVQLYFNVYNDGVGGRAAMFLDDVSLAACPTGPTPAPTGTLTATTGPLTATPTPSPTPGCVDLVADGRFDSGLASWQVVGDPAGATVVNTPARSAPLALKLGSLEQPLNSLTTVRQLVSLPAGYPFVSLEAWVYTQAQPGAGADYQEMALLTATGGPLYLPWRVQENNPAWHPLNYNISAFAGQTVFLSFSVNNDGIGGRTVMYVDDVRIRACTGGITVSPTPGTTPSPTRTPTATPPPTGTTVPAGCVELTRNGGFESGFAPWRAGASSLPPQLVGDPVLQGTYAMRLGSQTDNRNTYSSIRQTITVPAGRPRVVISFWTYTWAESLTGSDQQQFVLLGPGDQVWARPWSVLEDARAWEQHVFDVIGAAGLTFDLYFNVINDGAGGRTAMFVDEVYAWACTADAYPAPLISPAPAAPSGHEAPAMAEGLALPGTPQVGAVPPTVETRPPVGQTTAPPGWQGSGAGGQTPQPNLTAVSIITPAPSPTVVAATVTATATASVIPRPTAAPRETGVRAPGFLDRLRNLGAESADRLRLLVILIIAAFLALVGVLAWLVRRS